MAPPCLGKNRDTHKQNSSTLVTDGNCHSIGVNVESNKRDSWPINLFLFFVRDSQLIPEEKEARLVRRKVTAIWGVVQNITNPCKGCVVINIYLQVLDPSHADGDPTNKRSETEPDNI
jgi:hypothetical protein